MAIDLLAEFGIEAPIEFEGYLKGSRCLKASKLVLAANDEQRRIKAVNC